MRPFGVCVIIFFLHQVRTLENIATHAIQIRFIATSKLNDNSKIDKLFYIFCATIILNINFCFRISGIILAGPPPIFTSAISIIVKLYLISGFILQFAIESIDIDDAATITESNRSSICAWERNTQPGIRRED